MNVQDNMSKESEKALFIQKSEEMKKLFVQLLLTSKNVSLYPAGHSISLNSIGNFHETLEAYIRKHGDIRFEFERERVTCQEMNVQTGPPEEGSLPFTLFRDGIRWLEFAEGITLEETRELLTIIHQYSVLTKEPEGDIVTAFWEAHFNHILYQADDFISEQATDSLESMTKFQATPEDQGDGSESADVSETAALHEDAQEPESSEQIGLDPDSFVLTAREQIALQDMIAREEMLSATEHLNMLLDMLLQYKEEKDFSIILEVISEEFDGSIRRHDFEATLIILDGLRRVLDSGRLRSPYAHDLIEKLYGDISSADRCLEPLKDAWSSLNAQQIEIFKNIFQHLQPQAIHTLTEFLLLGQPSQLEQLLQDTIIALINRDTNPLNQLIGKADEKVAEKLVSVLSKVEGNISLKYLMKLARHPSPSARRLAVKTIGQIEGDYIPSIFEFLNDPDESVRRTILKQMSRTRNEAAEDLLLQYLQNHQFDNEEAWYISECLVTLGRCGSERCIPFLRDILLQRKRIAGAKKSVCRQGAAFALAALKMPEASRIIEAAGRSFSPSLRRIARKAEKEVVQKNKKGS